MTFIDTRNSYRPVPVCALTATNQREDHPNQPNIADENIDPLPPPKTEIVDLLPQSKTETKTQGPDPNNPSNSITPFDASQPIISEDIPENYVLLPTIPETPQPARETEGDQAPTLEIVDLLPQSKTETKTQGPDPNNPSDSITPFDASQPII
jgi:hypothetical protein